MAGAARKPQRSPPRVTAENGQRGGDGESGILALVCDLLWGKEDMSLKEKVCGCFRKLEERWDMLSKQGWVIHYFSVISHHGNQEIKFLLLSLPRCTPAAPCQQPGLAGRAHAGHDLPRRFCQGVDNHLLRMPRPPACCPPGTDSGTRGTAAEHTSLTVSVTALPPRREEAQGTLVSAGCSCLYMSF